MVLDCTNSFACSFLIPLHLFFSFVPPFFFTLSRFISLFLSQTSSCIFYLCFNSFSLIHFSGFIVSISVVFPSSSGSLSNDIPRHTFHFFVLLNHLPLYSLLQHPLSPHHPYIFIQPTIPSSASSSQFFQHFSPFISLYVSNLSPSHMSLHTLRSI